MSPRFLLLLLLLAAPSRAQLDPSEWHLDGGAILSADQLLLATCSSLGGSDYVYVTQQPLLPGTWKFDLRWNEEVDNFYTVFDVWAGGQNVVSIASQQVGVGWCSPAPCSGELHELLGHVTVADGLVITLSADELGCGTPPLGSGGTVVRLIHWSFTPDPGVWPGPGALDAADHGFVTAPSTATDYGRAVAQVGDLDGDGVPDVVAGSSGESPGGGVRVQSAATGATIFEKHGNGIGGSVAAVGDLDGDGLPDFASSAAAGVLAWSGASGSQILHADGGTAGSTFGASVAGAGDVDLDGVPDLVAGAPWADPNQTGRVRVLSGVDGSTLWEITNFLDTYQAHLGTSVAGVGDMDGDGRPDVLAGAPATWWATTAPGRALLLSGANGAMLHAFPGTEPASHCGSGVCLAGDADADGTQDLAIGSSNAGQEAGLVRVFSGATNQLLFSVTGATVGEFLGWATQMSPLGDVNGDGHDDLLLGAPSTYYGGNGRIEIRSGADGSQLLNRSSPVKNAHFGAAVAGGLDLDGDGVPDMAVGAPFDDAGLPQWSGKVHLFSGLPPLHLAPQLLANGTLLPGSPFVLTVVDGTPSAPMLLVLGLSTSKLPLKGGLLVPSADLVLSALALDAAGTLTLSGTWPAGLSGLTIWSQAWIATPAADHGFTASNALAIVPP